MAPLYLSQLLIKYEPVFNLRSLQKDMSKQSLVVKEILSISILHSVRQLAKAVHQFKTAL